jgi:hypothetical protein
VVAAWSRTIRRGSRGAAQAAPIRLPSTLAALLGMGDVIHFPLDRRAKRVVEAELARAREKSELQRAAAAEVRERRRREAAVRDTAEASSEPPAARSVRRGGRVFVEPPPRIAPPIRRSRRVPTE